MTHLATPQRTQPNKTQAHTIQSTELLWKLKLALKTEQDLDIPLKELLHNDRFRRNCILNAHQSENPKLISIAKKLTPKPSKAPTTPKEQKTTQRITQQEQHKPPPLKRDTRSDALNLKNLSILLLALTCSIPLIFFATNQHTTPPTNATTTTNSTTATTITIEESPLAAPTSHESAPPTPHKQSEPETASHEHQSPPQA